LTITVRLAGPADAAELAALVREQDLHYHDGNPGKDATLSAVNRWLAADGALGRFAIAYDSGEPAGFSAFAIVHPGYHLTGLLFMKDLFVSEARRGHGVGEAIIRFLCGFCVENGIGRIDFPTDLANERAQAFYESLGARRFTGAGYHRIDGEMLERLAAGAEG
jgi:GNAT superfamily N-acetyltransferase